jgi:hypothetical protein
MVNVINFYMLQFKLVWNKEVKQYQGFCEKNKTHKNMRNTTPYQVWVDEYGHIFKKNYIVDNTTNKGCFQDEVCILFENINKTLREEDSYISMLYRRPAKSDRIIY